MSLQKLIEKTKALSDATYLVVEHASDIRKLCDATEKMYRLMVKFRYQQVGNASDQAHELLKQLDSVCVENKPKDPQCSCPPKKYDGSAFDGVDYYCPLHGR